MSKLVTLADHLSERDVADLDQAGHKAVRLVAGAKAKAEKLMPFVVSNTDAGATRKDLADAVFALQELQTAQQALMLAILRRSK